jgi:hypothetical protein
MGSLLKGIGNTLEVGVKATDAVVKDKIDKDVYSVVDSERTAFTLALEDRKDVTNKVKGQPLNVMGVDMQALPADVEKVGDYASNLKKGFLAKNYSHTHYLGRLNEHLKDLRSQYPGYRDYIDQKVSAVTGYNMANAYQASVISDLNALASSSNTEQNKARDFAMKNIGLIEVAGLSAAAVIQGVEQGRLSLSNIVHMVAPFEKDEAQWKINAGRRSDLKTSMEEKSALAKQDMEDNATSTVNSSFNVMLSVDGPNGKNNVAELVRNWQTGNGSINVQQALELENIVRAQRQRISNQLYQKYNTKDDDGTSPAAKYGLKQTQDLIDTALKPYDDVINSLTNKEYGAAFRAVAAGQARIDDRKNELLADPKLGPYLRDAAALDAMGKNFGLELMNRHLNKGAFNIYDQKVVEDATKAGTQPGAAQGKYFTLNEGIQKLSNNPPPKSQAPSTYDGYVKLAEDIGGNIASDGQKINLAKASFTQGNIGFVSNFKQDERMNIFARMTNPAVTAEIFRLGKQDPSVITEYTKWARHTFGAEIFNRDIKELNEIQMDPRFELFYDTELNAFSARAKNPINSYEELPQARKAREYQLADIQERLGQLNKGLGSMAGIAKAAKSDPDSFVMELLVSNGYRPQAKPEGTTSLPQALTNAIVSARASREEGSKIEAGLGDMGDIRMFAAPGQDMNWGRPDGNLTVKEPKSGNPVRGQVHTQEVTQRVPMGARALLDTIAGSESPGYNVRYGGKTFDDYSKFPAGAAVIANGPNAGKTSSAAGRYQFLKGTWNRMAGKLGLQDFSPRHCCVATCSRCIRSQYQGT